MMIQAAEVYPEYRFEKHKGYGTAAHLKALKTLGPCPIHRMSFEPLRSRYETGQLSLFPEGKGRPGGTGENRAAAYLKQSGYHILERNFRSGAGEIDIIAEKDGTVFFVEVKSSYVLDSNAAMEKISGEKIRRIRQTAESWIMENGFQGDVELLGIIVTSAGIQHLSIK